VQDLLRERTNEEFKGQGDSDGPRDFVDVFVQEMKQQSKKSSNQTELLTGWT